MKKLFYLLLLLPLLFNSCSSDDDDSKTSYQIVNNFKFESTTAGMDGSMYDVVIFCFIGDDVVREDNYDKISSMDKSAIKEVPDNFEKIKISFKMVPPDSPLANLPANVRKYTVSYTMLEKGKNNIANLTGDTMLQNKLKSSSLKSDVNSSIYSTIQNLSE